MRQPRSRRYVPQAQAPTSHPRRGGLGSTTVGQRLHVHFSAVAPDGAAVARLGAATVLVPFAIPGEDAVIEITEGGRRARGRLVVVRRKSAHSVEPRCPHFGRCGGCQWQHVSLEAQRIMKTGLVRDHLKEHAGVRRDLVRPAVGGGAWAYRSTMQAICAARDGALAVGFHSAAGERVVDVSACPVQHPANEAMLTAVREALRSLRMEPYDRSTGAGLVRGVAGLSSFSTGEALLTLSTSAPIPDRSAVVRCLLDRVPGLVGILSAVRRPGAGDLLGQRQRLLWGRGEVEEEVAGFRLRLRPSTGLPANKPAAGHLVEAVLAAAALSGGEVALDMSAANPLVTLALAGRAESAVGASADRRAAGDGRSAAERNGVVNALFSARDGASVLSGMAVRRRRPALVVVGAEGPGLEARVIRAVVLAETPRLVYMARSLSTCARDLVRLRQAGYAVVGVQPVDLLPHTSHVHLVAGLRRAAPRS